MNGNPTFFFKGGPTAINGAIRRFAAIPAEKRDVILLPGPGTTKTFDGKPVAYDWTLHVPMGFSFGGDSEVADTRATLTIHITAPTPGPPADPATYQAWIGQLNSDDFKTRERAAKELAAVGPPAARTLREALKKTSSAEARDRLEKVLARPRGRFTLDVLDLPEGHPGRRPRSAPGTGAEGTGEQVPGGPGVRSIEPVVPATRPPSSCRTWRRC